APRSGVRRRDAGADHPRRHRRPQFPAPHSDARRRDRLRRAPMSSTAVRLQPRDHIARARLPVSQLLGTALQGPRTRRLRAALSALGIAIGIAAMVAVVGVSASAKANLLAEIDALGTNLLTVTPGQTFVGANEILPHTAVPMIDHMQQVDRAVAVYQVSSANVYRSLLVPQSETGGIGVDAAAD